MFTPQFRGQLRKLKSVQWQIKDDLFPKLHQARYINSFYMSNLQLILPKAQIT